jgi:hypothetical protein
MSRTTYSAAFTMATHPSASRGVTSTTSSPLWVLRCRVVQHPASSFDARLHKSGGVRATLSRWARDSATRVIQKFVRSSREKNRSRCLRNDFLEGAATPVSPFFATRIVPEVITPLKIFARSKTMWTLPPLWTHRTRPQGFGNLAKNARFPQRPHRSSFSLKKKKNEEPKPLRSTVHRNGSSPDGLFIGQRTDFIQFLFTLAAAADRAKREL